MYYMVANLQNDPNLNYVLNKMSNILNGNFANSDERDIKNYLEKAHDLFSQWKSVFELKYIKVSTLSGIQAQVKEFLLERNNGSWSGMQRSNANVPKEPNLKDALIKLLEYRTNNGVPDLDDVTKRIDMLSNKKSDLHINGMSIFFCTAVLFVHDPENFMVMDGPVRDIFQVKNDPGQLANYNNIIQQSKSIISKFPNLDTWHINKAYAISMDRKQIKIGHLGGSLLDLGKAHKISL